MLTTKQKPLAFTETLKMLATSPEMTPLFSIVLESVEQLKRRFALLCMSWFALAHAIKREWCAKGTHLHCASERDG